MEREKKCERKREREREKEDVSNLIGFSFSSLSF
jgi:hypothetical protein